MDINFETSPFSNFAGFTNKELEDIWKYLFKKNPKLPDELEVIAKLKLVMELKFLYLKIIILNKLNFL